jgi:hypothetical protein
MNSLQCRACFAEGKELAESFARHWRQVFGNARLVYAYSADGKHHLSREEALLGVEA